MKRVRFPNSVACRTLWPCALTMPPLPGLALSLIHQENFSVWVLIVFVCFPLLPIHILSLSPARYFYATGRYINQISTKISPPEMVFLDHPSQRCWAFLRPHHVVPFSSPPGLLCQLVCKPDASLKWDKGSKKTEVLFPLLTAVF